MFSFYVGGVYEGRAVGWISCKTVKAWFLPSLLFMALFCSDCNWSQSQMQNGTFPKSCVCQDLIEDPFKEEAQWMVTVRTLRLLANAARQLKGRLKTPRVRGFQDGGARFKLRANRSAIKCQLPRYNSLPFSLYCHLIYFPESANLDLNLQTLCNGD